MGTPITNRLKLERLRAGRQVTERIEKKQCQVSDGLFPKSLFAWSKTFFDKSKACYRRCQNSPSGLKQLTSRIFRFAKICQQKNVLMTAQGNFRLGNAPSEK
ncbi:MAG: hypothetical protein DRH43_01020 [Deltaproteobacteria bacterium]|nr:MAG: hypothetical protein DRH43_01020 [Deltaproteobacteria bacterium]